MRKILYSPGFGAGWSTWADDRMKKWMCEYTPLIEAIEAGEEVWDEQLNYNYHDLLYLDENYKEINPEAESFFHPAMWKFILDSQDKWGTVPYLGGARDLEVYTCSDDTLVRISEYDGSESVQSNYNEEYF